MSMDPSMMQSLLARQLSSGGGAAPAAAPGQVQSQTGAPAMLAQIAQKAMLMKALQGQQQGQQQQQANAGMPAANAQMAQDPSMQALQQSPQGVLTPQQLQALQQQVDPAPAAQ